MAKQLKVAYILHRFPKFTETFIMREVYWLRKQGVHVEIFSLLPPQKSVVHDQAYELLEVTHYGPYLSLRVVLAQLYFLLRSPWRYLKAVGNLIRQTFREPEVLMLALLLFPKTVYFAHLIEQKKIDHIHAHFVWINGVAAGVVRDLIGTTFTIHPHAFGLFGRNQKSVKSELEHATQVITISEFHRQYIQRLCPELSPAKIHVVYCALETDLFRSQNRSIEDGLIQILSVGRLMEKKGFTYLIDACRQLADRNLDFECNIIGGGPLKKALQAQIDNLELQGQVKLIGALEQKQVMEFYRNCDIFALPCVVAGDGDRDGIPVVLMEAMACEIPVVTTPVTGIPDLIQHEATGLLVAERDVVGLAAALESIIGDKQLRRMLGQQGRQIILEKCDISKNVAQLATIFKKISHTDFPEPCSGESTRLEVPRSPLKPTTIV